MNNLSTTTGFEPATLTGKDFKSFALTTRPRCHNSLHVVSNHGPSVYKTDALPLSHGRHNGFGGKRIRTDSPANRCRRFAIKLYPPKIHTYICYESSYIV